MDGRKLRVLVAMQATLHREALCKAVSSVEPLSVIGNARDWIRLRPLAQMETPDIILVGLPLEGLGSPEELLDLRVVAPNAKIIVILTYHTPAVTVMRFLKAGARGVLGLNAHFEELTTAVMSVWNNDLVMPTRLFERLFDKSSQVALAPNGKFTLSGLESSILTLVAKGAKDKSIAKELSIGLRTVHEHLARIYRKLGASNRVQACLIAAQNGLINLDASGTDHGTVTAGARLGEG